MSRFSETSELTAHEPDWPGPGRQRRALARCFAGRWSPRIAPAGSPAGRFDPSVLSDLDRLGYAGRTIGRRTSPPSRAGCGIHGAGRDGSSELGAHGSRGAGRSRRDRQGARPALGSRPRSNGCGVARLPARSGRRPRRARALTPTVAAWPLGIEDPAGARRAPRGHRSDGLRRRDVVGRASIAGRSAGANGPSPHRPADRRAGCVGPGCRDGRRAGPRVGGSLVEGAVHQAGDRRTRRRPGASEDRRSSAGGETLPAQRGLELRRLSACLRGRQRSQPRVKRRRPRDALPPRSTVPRPGRRRTHR